MTQQIGTASDSVALAAHNRAWTSICMLSVLNPKDEYTLHLQLQIGLVVNSYYYISRCVFHGLSKLFTVLIALLVFKVIN